MKDFLSKGMAKCKYKTKPFWDSRIKKMVPVSIVCPESAVVNGDLVCLRRDEPVSDLVKCPPMPRKKKAYSPVNPELPGMPNG